MKNHNCPSNIAILHQGQIIYRCDDCIDDVIKGNPEAAKHRREWDKKQYRKDTIQPTESQARDYAKLYPDDFRKRFGDNNYRKYS